MAMPNRKSGRRKITVDGIVYWWNPTKWEATEYIRILGESGRGAKIHVSPLQIMTPKDIAACIKHAISVGWNTESSQDLWLGFDESDSGSDIFQIPPNSNASRNETTGRWELPRMKDA